MVGETLLTILFRAAEQRGADPIFRYLLSGEAAGPAHCALLELRVRMPHLGQSSLASLPSSLRKRSLELYAGVFCRSRQIFLRRDLGPTLYKRCERSLPMPAPA